MEIRSFLAFELPEEIKGVLSRVSEELKKSPLDVRRVKTENIHLTVVFLGNVPEEHISPVSEAAEEVCQRYSPFNVSLKGAGVFGSKKRPRVLWIGLEGDMERMSCFRDDLQKGLAIFGIKQEKRRFRPHLTLGRFRKDSRADARLDEFLSSNGDLTSPVCPVGELFLFRSDLNPGGAVYSKMKSWPLTGEHYGFTQK